MKAGEVVDVSEVNCLIACLLECLISEDDCLISVDVSEGDCLISVDVSEGDCLIACLLACLISGDDCLISGDVSEGECLTACLLACLISGDDCLISGDQRMSLPCCALCRGRRRPVSGCSRKPLARFIEKLFAIKKSVPRNIWSKSTSKTLNSKGESSR